MNPFRRYRAVWPVIDETRTLQDHVTEATPDLAALLGRGRLQPHGDTRWRVMPGRYTPGSRGAPTVLVADLCVERLARPVDPDETTPEDSSHPLTAWLEDVAFLAGTGHTLEDVAGRLHRQPDSIRARLHHAGRDDLTAALTRNETARNAA